MIGRLKFPHPVELETATAEQMAAVQQLAEQYGADRGDSDFGLQVSIHFLPGGAIDNMETHGTTGDEVLDAADEVMDAIAPIAALGKGWLSSGKLF